MNPFDKWFKEKAKQQHVEYRPEYWSGFATYRKKREKIFYWKWAGIILLLLSLPAIGLITAFNSSQQNENPEMAFTSEKEAVSDVLKKEVNNYGKNESHPIVVNESHMPKSEAESVKINDKNLRHYSAKNTTGTKEQMETESLNALAAEKNARTIHGSVSDKSDEAGVSYPLISSTDRQGKSFPELESGKTLKDVTLPSLHAESPVSLLTGNIDLLEAVNLSPADGRVKDHPFPSLPIEKTFIQTRFSLGGQVLIHPFATANEHLFLGGRLGGQLSIEFERKWYINTGLGLLWRRGNYGVQLDHPQWVFEFERKGYGYQTRPGSAVYAGPHFHLGIIRGPWTFYGGSSIHFLLAVRGELIRYTPNPSNLASGVIEEKLKQGWTGREGFQNIVPSLDLGFERMLTHEWSMGMSLEYMPGGWIDTHHQPLPESLYSTHLPEEKNPWELRENKYQLTVFLKYHFR